MLFGIMPGELQLSECQETVLLNLKGWFGWYTIDTKLKVQKSDLLI